MNNVNLFLKGLDELSRKHGVWIEGTKELTKNDLVGADMDVIAEGFYLDEDTQEYKVL